MRKLMPKYVYYITKPIFIELKQINRFRMPHCANVVPYVMATGVTLIWKQCFQDQLQVLVVNHEKHQKYI